MRDNLKKSIKRWLKRKVTITLGMIVAFMITGGVVYSNDVINQEVNIKIENETIVVTPEEAGILVDSTWTNSGKVEVTEGNGITIDSSITKDKNLNLINNGVIVGNSSSGYENGNGIYNSNGIIKILTNNGIILAISNNVGNNQSNYNNNGIYNLNGIIESLINNGIIAGSNNSDYESGNGICKNNNSDSNTIIENLINNGIIAGIANEKAFNSGNGIYNLNGVIKNLINNGIIAGVANENTSNSGNGIYSLGGENFLNIINNIGTITGNSNSLESNSGNGIYNNLGRVESLKSSGIITGNSNSGNWCTGNGILNLEVVMEILTNSGVIIGNDNNNNLGYYSGNGILNYGNLITQLTNSGIILGKTNSSDFNGGNGIYNYSGKITTLMNYGIIAGNNKALEGADIGNNNYGLLIDGAGTNNIIINAGAGGEIQETGDYFGYTIMNTFNSGTTNIDSETQVTLSGNNNKLIINGYNKGLYVDNFITLSNSIINSYTSAINIDGGNLTGDNIIVNGGVDKKYDSSNILISQSSVITGSTNVDTLTLKGNSIINGNIDLGDGADNLIIANTVQINGELFGGNGDDTLTFNSGDTSTFALNENNINIFNNVDGFETINIATNVTFFETSQVTGANNISIKKDGNLILRIDSTNNYSNAFSNNTGTISSEGGKLLLALNGIGEGETINFGNTILDDTIKGNEIGYSSDITLDTTSLLYTLARGEGNTIKVNTVENLPLLPPIDETPEEDNEEDDNITPPIEDNNTSNIDEYNNLNSIYQSIRDNNLVKEFDVTDDNKLAGFYSYLHDIYAGNPVAFSSTLSKKSSSMFSDIVMNKDLTTDINKWSIYGGFTHIDGGTKDSYYGKKDYIYNIVNKDIDVDSKISGMYALGEYGLSNNSTFGIIFGGNQAQSKLNNGSKVDGDSFYLGTYTKKYLGNLKLVAGLGYQYGDYKSDRVAIGYENIIDTKTYHSNYNDNTLSIYGQAKYSNKLAENLYLEPSIGIEYTYIDQNESSESGILGIETESKEFNYTTAKFGVDLRKDIPTSSATHSLVTGVYYNRMLDGYDVQNIKGSFKEENNFDILVSPSNKHELGLRAKYELSLNNGVTFDLKGSYTFAREKYNNDNKNEYKGEWLIGTGIGYKF